MKDGPKKVYGSLSDFMMIMTPLINVRPQMFTLFLKCYCHLFPDPETDSELYKYTTHKLLKSLSFNHNLDGPKDLQQHKTQMANSMRAASIAL